MRIEAVERKMLSMEKGGSHPERWEPKWEPERPTSSFSRLTKPPPGHPANNKGWNKEKEMVKMMKAPKKGGPPGVGAVRPRAGHTNPIKVNMGTVTGNLF